MMAAHRDGDASSDLAMLSLDSDCLDSGSLDSRSQDGGAFIAVLMALGMLGFFIAVVTAGLEQARKSTNLMLADGEYHDLRESISNLQPCRLSCSDFKAEVPARSGVWQLRVACRGDAPRVYTRAFLSNSRLPDRYASYRKWREIQSPKLGGLCAPKDGRLAGQGLATCPRPEQSVYRIDWKNGKIECR